MRWVKREKREQQEEIASRAREDKKREEVHKLNEIDGEEEDRRTREKGRTKK